MRTNYVLVDYENVQLASLHGLNSEQFKVLVFVGASQSKISLGFATSMQTLGDRAQYVQITGNGHNALDFHIAFYLGRLATQDPDAYFHVISRDTGFDPLIEHLRSRQTPVMRSASIESRWQW
ncbi:MAG: hypothetical protein EON93_21360 [Burkholderiales bacterium]|nr:MAG: hypothetical protein EON93_21360 [Burkholderiales bacterium]